MNKQLGLSILEISKTWIYEFQYDYLKPKHKCNAKLCYMDTNSFIIHTKTEDAYKDIANDVEKRFNTPNFSIECNSIDRPLQKGKNKEVIGLMKDDLGGKIIRKFVGLRPKTFLFHKWWQWR